MDLTIVCIGSENPGNIGAIARAMANFDLHNLILISPVADHLDPDALRRSKHASSILNNAKVYDYSYFKKKSKKSIFKDFDTIIGTTSILGRDYNLKRLPLTPEKAAKNTNPSRTALIIGRDGSGLNNEELMLCDILITIPASKDYHALNISHAASIIFYEFYKLYGTQKIDSHITQASRKEREVIISKFNNIIKNLEFQTPHKKNTQITASKNIINKSFLTKREAFALLGLLTKIEEKIT